MFLPYSDPDTTPAGAWVDYETDTTAQQTTADAAGAAVVTFATVPQDQRWLVDRVVCSTDNRGAGSAWFLMYLDELDARNLIDGTNAGDFDVNDADAPIEVPGGSALVCAWEGAEPGALCTVRIHYAIQRQVG